MTWNQLQELTNSKIYLMNGGNGYWLQNFWDQLYTNLLLGKERALGIKRVFLGSRVMQNLTNLKQTAKLRPNTPHKGVQRQDLCLKPGLYTIHPSKYSAKETGDTPEHPSSHIKQKVWRSPQKRFPGYRIEEKLVCTPRSIKRILVTYQMPGDF